MPEILIGYPGFPRIKYGAGSVKLVPYPDTGQGQRLDSRIRENDIKDTQ